MNIIIFHRVWFPRLSGDDYPIFKNKLYADEIYKKTLAKSPPDNLLTGPGYNTGPYIKDIFINI